MEYKTKGVCSMAIHELDDEQKVLQCKIYRWLFWKYLWR